MESKRKPKRKPSILGDPYLRNNSTLTQTHKHTQTHTHTHRQTDTQTDRQAHKQTSTQTDTQTHRDTQRQTHSRTNTNKHTWAFLKMVRSSHLTVSVPWLRTSGPKTPGKQSHVHSKNRGTLVGAWMRSGRMFGQPDALTRCPPLRTNTRHLRSLSSKTFRAVNMGVFLSPTFH